MAKRTKLAYIRHLNQHRANLELHDGCPYCKDEVLWLPWWGLK
jgi:hypothetical protein